MGPYSPMHNAVEQAWSCLKAGTRKNVSDEMPSILDNENRGQLPKDSTGCRDWRPLSNMQLITAAKWPPFMVHVKYFVASAIGNEEVLV